MGALDLSVQVLNISPKATEEDLHTFFQYCGTIEKIQLQREGDQSQTAFVTFKQQYALRTALLLNDAIIVDRRVRISPLEIGKSVPILPSSPKNRGPERWALLQIRSRFIPAAHSTVQAAALKGKKVLARTKDRVSDAGKILTHQTNTAILSAEQTVGSMRSASSNYISKGALWLSEVLHKASKNVADLGNAKSINPNSRKQK